MPSMRDVAKLAGVSVSTVSRVINQSIPVDEKTKSKVLDAVEKLNFRPNLLAKGLRVKSGHLIGFVVPEITHHPFVNFINHIEECVVRNGFNLIIGNTHNDPDIEEEFIDSLIRRNIDGIIFSRVSEESRVLDILRKSDIPIVALDRELEEQNVPSVILNNYRAGRMAAEHLVGLGHTKIACITGPLNIKLCRERLRGFKEVLTSHGIELPQSHLCEGTFKFESGIDAARNFLNRKIRITALWAQNDLMAIGALKALNTSSIRIPDDISLMGMDDLGITEMVTPSLTTIAQPFKAMSEKAIELIFHKEPITLKDNKIVLEPSLIVRNSTSPHHE